MAEVQLYEDKITQYELLRLHGLPVVDTFVSHSGDETMEYLATCRYPLVWKITAGSGSLGVELIRTRRSAERCVRRVFSFAGRRTYWPYVSQKNYVILQDYVPNAGPDIRVIVIGPMTFGYYRDVPAGEFRASGMGTVRLEAPPEEAMRLARRAAEALDLPHVAVDMIADGEGTDLQIIELSSFWQIRTPGQLLLDGESGAYVFDATKDEYRFVPMCVWSQELALKRVIETRWFSRAAQTEGESQ